MTTVWSEVKRTGILLFKNLKCNGLQERKVEMHTRIEKIKPFDFGKRTCHSTCTRKLSDPRFQLFTIQERRFFIFLVGEERLFCKHILFKSHQKRFPQQQFPN